MRPDTLRGLEGSSVSEGVVPGERVKGLQIIGSHLAVAVFDNWDSLQAVLMEMECFKATKSIALLHGRTDVPAQMSASRLLTETVELRFERSRQPIACTAGPVLEALSARVARGARTLADAFNGWLGSNQAKQVESHLDRGHLILCIELRTSDDFSGVCGRLVKASPHIVELCEIDFKKS